MKKRIFFAILSVAIVVLLLTAFFVAIIIGNYYVGEIKKDMQKRASDLLTIYNLNGVSDLHKLGYGTFIRVSIIDEKGMVVFDNFASSDILGNHIDREEIREAQEKGYGESTRYSDTIAKNTYYYALKAKDGNVIRVARTMSSMIGIFTKGVLPFIFAMLPVILIIALISRRFTSKLVKPINELNLDEPLSNNTYEELSPLLSRMSKQKIELERNLQTIEYKTTELNKVVENMEEGIAIFSSSGSILNINKSMEKDFGVKSGQSFLSLSRLPEFVSLVEKGLSGEKGNIIVGLKNKSILLSGSPIEVGKNKFALVLLAIDITEKEKNEKIRREFSANVSHELKTPLTSIMGYAELIEKGIVKQEDMNAFGAKINEEAKRLLQLIEDIIELSRLEEGSGENTEKLDVKNKVLEVFADLENKARKKRVTLSLSGESFKLVGNKRAFGEVLFNLVDNAINYNKEGGTVQVGFNETEKEKVLTVTDSGIGIPKSSLERVFERFYRVDKSRSKQTGGTGLGLAIARHAVERLGGKIYIESELGVYTTVTVTFKK